MKRRILFILKRREDYNQEHYSNEGLTTGLYNSATFVKEMLEKNKIPSKLVVVIDNNDIHREVSLFKPTDVIIEGLWVVPEKFNILRKLHPDVQWIVRIHSNAPFLANEGIAFNWIGKYVTIPKVKVATNAKQILNELRFYVKDRYSLTPVKEENNIVNLLNYYPETFKQTRKIDSKSQIINIGCFGAIRPLKNQLTQAIAAVKFAEGVNKKLHFHINTGRIEMNGLAIYNNLKAFFESIKNRGHELVEHPWTTREEFLGLCRQMDIGMQVSFSETFNIVAADFISQGVPVVCTKEIPWANNVYTVSPTNSDAIANAIRRTYKYYRINVALNRMNLLKYSKNSKNQWLKYFK